MSKRLDILGARIFGASVCYARKYLQPFRKCPNVWTKSPDLAIMHKHKPHIIRTKACICAFCYFVDFLHTFLDIFVNPVHPFILFPKRLSVYGFFALFFIFFSNFSARFTSFSISPFPAALILPPASHYLSALILCNLFLCII